MVSIFSACFNARSRASCAAKSSAVIGNLTMSRPIGGVNPLGASGFAASRSSAPTRPNSRGFFLSSFAAAPQSKRPSQPVRRPLALARRILLHRDAQSDLADVRVDVRRVHRKAVPVRGEPERMAQRDVVSQPEQRPPTRLATAAGARDAGTHRAETQAAEQEETTPRGRVEARRGGDRVDGEGRPVLGLHPSVARDAEQELRAQRAAEGDVAAQAAGTTAAILATERAIAQAGTEPEAVT